MCRGDDWRAHLQFGIHLWETLEERSKWDPWGPHLLWDMVIFVDVLCERQFLCAVKNNFNSRGHTAYYIYSQVKCVTHYLIAFPHSNPYEFYCVCNSEIYVKQSYANIQHLECIHVTDMHCKSLKTETLWNTPWASLITGCSTLLTGVTTQKKCRSALPSPAKNFAHRRILSHTVIGGLI